MKVSRESMQMYIVSDRTWLQGRTLYDVLKECLEGGATFLQLREKDVTQAKFIEEAKEIRQLAKEYEIPFVINDDIDVAIAADVDGAHIGQSDGSVKVARQKLGPNKILGVSVQNVEQALLAQADGADYLGVGSMFTTSTKLDADHVSIQTLHDICAATTIPVVAIGGINLDNIKQLQGSGVDGVAVISAILASKDIQQATQAFKTSAKALS